MRIIIISVTLTVLSSMIFIIPIECKCIDFEGNIGHDWINCENNEIILDNQSSKWYVDTSQSYSGDSSLIAIAAGLEPVRICREIEVEDDTNVTFWWKLSDEGGRLVFRIDGAYKDGLLQNEEESKNWTESSHIISVRGTHRLEWIFFRTKPESSNQFGWIDYICIDTGDEYPTIILESPEDNASFYVDEIVDFSYIPEDDQGLISCTLLIDDIEKNRKESPENGSINLLSYSFDKPGEFKWCIKCCDDVTQCTLKCRSISIEDPRPTINLDSPVNGSQSFIGRTIEFRYTPSDNNELQNCTLILNGTEQEDIRNYRPENDEINVFNYTFYNSGDHKWCIRCYDSQNQDNLSETRIITILPDENPSVELILPPNNALYFVDENIPFKYRASDDKMLQNCTLMIDGQPVMDETINEANTTGCFNHRFDENRMADDVEEHNWTVVCYDNKSKSNDIITIRNVSVMKDKPPVVMIESVQTGSVNRTVSFKYNSTDDRGIIECVLLIDGEVHNISEEATGFFDYNFSQEGNYIWNVTCWDSRDQYGSSEDSISITRPSILFVNETPNETEYRHINDAIRDIASGGTIKVKPGEYRENIIINKEVSLVGLAESDMPKINPEDGIPIKITIGNVLIEGFEVLGRSHEPGISLRTDYFNDYGNIKILSNKIVQEREKNACIFLFGRDGNRIYDLNVTDNSVDGCSRVGIYLYNCSGNLSNNSINCDEIYRRPYIQSHIYRPNPLDVIFESNTRRC